jgi:hypothetical protein
VFCFERNFVDAADANVFIIMLCPDAVSVYLMLANDYSLIFHITRTNGCPDFDYEFPYNITGPRIFIM